MSFPIRSARVKTNGLFVFARVLDKIRLHAKGELPDGYTVGLVAGKRTFDDRLVTFLGVDFSALTEKALQTDDDVAVLDWVYQTCGKPSDEQIYVWNAFIEKRGWRDEASPGLITQISLANLSHRDDILTFFDLFDAEEGR